MTRLQDQLDHWDRSPYNRITGMNEIVGAARRMTDAKEIRWCLTHWSGELESGRWPKCALSAALSSKRPCRWVDSLILIGKVEVKTGARGLER